jgi:hypothetical protein
MKSVNAYLNGLSLVTGVYAWLMELHGFFDETHYSETHFKNWPQEATLLAVLFACLDHIYSTADAWDTKRLGSETKKWCFKVLTYTTKTRNGSKEDAQKGAENAANMILYNSAFPNQSDDGESFYSSGSHQQ